MSNRTKPSLTRSALLLAAFVLAPGAVAQTTWYVDDGAICPGAGTDLDEFCLIQQAVLASVDGDTVFIRAGTYNESINLLGRAITIEGEDKDLVFLDGTGLTESLITCSTGETSATVIQGLTIINGNSDPTYGGGMFIENASPTVRDCNFIDNVAFWGRGGAIALVNSDSIIEDCYFEGNNTGTFDGLIIPGEGGAIYNETSRTQILRCVFYNNWAGYREDLAQGGKGGAIKNAVGSDVFIENCRFISNDASLGGGAIHNAASTCEIVGSFFNWNWSIEGDGGAHLWNKSSTVTVTNCTMLAAAVGASAIAEAILNDDSTRTITNTVITSVNAISTPLIADLGIVSGDIDYNYITVPFAGTGAGAHNIDTGMLVTAGYGPDLSMGTPDDEYRVHPKSSTTDAGNTPVTTDAGTRSPTGYLQDLNGGDRIGNGCGTITGVGDPCVDIGAYEVQNNGSIIVPDDFLTIQAAINEWNDVYYCSGIMVRGGTYPENINLQGKPVTLYAEYPTESSYRAIIDGQALGPVVTFNSAEGRDTVLEGFVITNGLAVDGGGMYILKSSPTIQDCSIEWNTATSSSGAVFVWDEFGTGVADPLFENCTFSFNTAGEFGVNTGTGGVARIIGSATFTDCVFENNIAAGVTPADGSAGAVDIPLNSIVNFERCSFSGNRAGGGGGALTYGGGYLLTISHCLFEENSSGVGGAIRFSYTPAVIEHTRFVGNTATGDGGAVHMYNSSITLEECEFSSNSAISNGGAIYLQTSSTSIGNCALSNNVSGADGGAVYLLSGSVPITNSIVWGNSTPQLAWDPSQPNITANYSDIEGGGFGTLTNIDEDPDFVDAANDDLHLLSWSPCIDAADNTALPYISDPLGIINLDLDGNYRFANAPYTADTGITAFGWPDEIADMGPYELQAQDQFCPGDTNGDGYLDNGDIGILIALFLAGDPAADINGDGFLDNGDLIAFLAHFLTGC